MTHCSRKGDRECCHAKINRERQEKKRNAGMNDKKKSRRIKLNRKATSVIELYLVSLCLLTLAQSVFTGANREAI